MHKLFRHAREFIADIRNEKYERSEGGILLKSSALLKGTYREGLANDPLSWREHENLIPAEGILKILGLAFYTDTRITAYYLAPFASNVAPTSGLTAASFPATQGEITSGSEGYSESTRVLWVPAAPAAGKVTNVASKGNFTIVTASQLTVWGSALLSASAKGATSGSLMSCVKYSVSRVLNNTDVWANEYEISLTDS